MTERPDWLKPQGDSMHYGPQENLVIFPCDSARSAVLDGTFTPQQLRDIAEWIEGHHD